MFEVTENASDKIKELLKDKESAPIRIMMSQGGCSGPALGMAIDEATEEDEVFDDRGLTYVIERDLYEEVKPLKVDYVKNPMGEGFSISSGMPMAGGCEGCHGSC